MCFVTQSSGQDVFAFVELGDTVVEIAPSWNNNFDSVDGVQALLKHLQPHTPQGSSSPVAMNLAAVKTRTALPAARHP